MRKAKRKFLTAMCLAIVGGYMEVFTYVLHGERFANTQTGNLIFFAINLFNNNFIKAMAYLPPIFAFILGIILSELIIAKNKEVTIINLAIEIILFLFIGFSYNYISDEIICIIVSFAESLQLAAFKEVRGIQFASIMCTGNLRNFSTFLCHAISHKDKKFLIKAFIVLGVIISFTFGAFFEMFMISIFKNNSIFAAIIFLIIILILLLFEEFTLRYKIKKFKERKQ